MTMNEPVIRIKGLKKIYKLGQIGSGTLRNDLQSWWAKVRGKEDPNTLIGMDSSRLKGKLFLALNGIDLDVHAGEAIGIIGANGAGKSTLLKILSQVTGPTEGEIVITGRIASMLEVGTGFNAEMTGRENIYMNGAILGMRKEEIDAKLKDIIAFSECGDFIDTPVKRYSSGMYVKLAFAVAAHLDSEILIMDEVLAVGDAKFQKKCLGKMENVASQEGKTILYVSHNMSTIRQLCSRCVVLQGGKIIFDGDTESAIALYMESNSGQQVKYVLSDAPRPNNGAGKQLRIDLLEFVGKSTPVYRTDEKMVLHIKGHYITPVPDVCMKLIIRADDGMPVGITKALNFTNSQQSISSVFEFTVEFDCSNLGEGDFNFDLDIFTMGVGTPLCLDAPRAQFSFHVINADEKIPSWSSGWGRVHFPDLQIKEF